MEVIADDMRTFFLGAYIIVNTHYELGNKLMKWFGHEKEVVFYTPIVKPSGRKKKASKKLSVDTSSQLFSFLKE
jgi:hypothetical protein